MKKILFWIAAVLLFTTEAGATVTIRNFQTDGVNTWRTMRLDTTGVPIDAHDGQLIQDPTDTQYIYRIGTSYDCGRRWLWSGYPFCGFKIYRTKSMVSGEWTDLGFMFDASGSTWQDRTVPLGGYRPHVIYCASCASDAKWKLWVNVTAGSNSYIVLKASTLAGPWTEVGGVGANAGDFDLFLDDNGDGYIVYIYYNNNWDVYIAKLNSTFTNFTEGSFLLLDGTGPHCPDGPGSPCTSVTYDMPILTKHGSNYVLFYSHTCGYCPGAEVKIAYATGDPLTIGNWTFPGTSLNANSCGGQPGGVAKINDGSDKWIFWSDLWKSLHDGQAGQTQYSPTVPLTGASYAEFGWANQARADFFEVPLTWSSDLPQTFTCDSTYTLALTADPPASIPNLTINSVNDSFFSFCDIRTQGGGIGPIWRYQTFTPTRTGLHTLKVLSAKSVIDSLDCQNTNGGHCPWPNVDLRISIHQDSTGSPGTQVATQDFDDAAVTTAMKWYSIVDVSLTSGTTYGFLMRPATTTPDDSAYCAGMHDAGPVAGDSYYSANQGSSYSVAEAGRDLMFQLIGPPIAGSTVKLPSGVTIKVPAGGKLLIQ